MKVGTIIATRRLVAVKGRKKVNVLVKIGKPIKRDKDFACPIQVKGIGDEVVRYASGQDSMQALHLALQMIGIELLLRHDDYKFSWLDQPDAGFIRPKVLTK
jgi:hypothetical protein